MHKVTLHSKKVGNVTGNLRCEESPTEILKHIGAVTEWMYTLRNTAQVERKVSGDWTKVTTVPLHKGKETRMTVVVTEKNKCGQNFNWNSIENYKGQNE